MHMRVDAKQEDFFRKLDKIEQCIGPRTTQMKMHYAAFGEQPIASAVAAAPIVLGQIAAGLDERLDDGEISELPLVKLPTDIEAVAFRDSFGLGFDQRTG